MRHFLAAFILLLSSGLKAQTYYENNTFKYRVRSEQKIWISSYLLDEETLTIPSKMEHEGKLHDVTGIEGLMYSTPRTNTKEVFIPQSVTEIGSGSYATALFKIPGDASLRTVVFENGGFTIGKVPFQFTKHETTNAFDNIIVLSKCDKKIGEISNATSTYLLKAGEISISYNDGSAAQTVQMYLYRGSQTAPWTFGQTRLEDLLSALVKSGKNPEDITTIDLSRMSTKSATITFSEMTLPSQYTNAKIVTSYITDLQNYTAPTTDLYGVFSYHRDNTQAWNSVCLPFAIKESDFPGNTKIYEMTSSSGSSINLTRLAESATLSAGTPCFIYSDVNEWNLSIQGTINADIAPRDVTQDDNLWILKGSFVSQTLNEGFYKLNGEGSAFVHTVQGSKISPFRCYIAPKEGQAPERLDVTIDDEASITLVPNDTEPQTVKLYDLMGRPRQGNASGIFIRSTH